MNANPIKQYLPVLLTVLVVVLQALYSALTDNRLTPVEILNVVLAVTAAITVYVLPVLPNLTWLKPIVSAVAAAVMVFISALAMGDGAGISAQTWVQAGVQLILGSGLVLLTQKNVPVTVPGEVVPAVGGGNADDL